MVQILFRCLDFNKVFSLLARETNGGRMGISWVEIPLEQWDLKQWLIFDFTFQVMDCGATCYKIRITHKFLV